ncbi:hypothetical protein MIMGU_mgv11b019593mg [Erythranthe guttata]|uniref:F-box domain-containing protein n=1 Tax=Erythranthe guttata TaxID=4155 RepID=A0A022QXJ8_ERYGU|nr:hypothetical protein MIMGU_mgv11b019593mg [Erythranthe guttata]
MADDKSDLPPEIIEIILLKLSVKSLLRFKSVSKSWDTMISDPVFVENHIQKSKESNSHNLFLRRSNLSTFIRFSAVKSEDKKFQTLGVLTETPPSNVGGLCCRIHPLEPRKSFGTKIVVVMHLSGFVVIQTPAISRLLFWIGSTTYSVYSCTNKSWITLRKEHDGLGLTITNPSGLCVNGASYWVMCSITTKIMYFDPRDDKFKMLDKPEQIDDRVVFLVNLRGSLCLYCYFEGVEKSTVRIWEKENGIDNSSWKELVTVEYDYVSIFSELEPLCFIENKIVFRKDCDRLVIYKPCEKSFEAFEKDTPVREIAMPPVKYMETLYFPIDKSKSKPNRKRKCLQ